MGNMNETEFEFENELHETELEAAGEAGEGEGILGAIGNALGGLFGESELEQHELGELHEGGLHEAGEWEGHGEAGELGELHELGESHGLGEFETGEQFFGRITRGIGRFVKRAAPLLTQIAKVAAPMVGTAIGGPFGAILGKAASSALGEAHGEFENHEGSLHELEAEFELHEFETHEGTHEAAHEVAHEIAQHEATLHEAYAEMLAEAAAHEQGEGQAEAMVGAAVVSVISPADRRALRTILPHLVRGAAILTRILRRRRVTRPYVRAVPTIMRRTVRSLKQQAAAGRPITRRSAARAAATQVQRVLSNPTACAAAIRSNVLTARKMAGPRRAVRG